MTSAYDVLVVGGEVVGGRVWLSSGTVVHCQAGLVGPRAGGRDDLLEPLGLAEDVERAVCAQRAASVPTWATL